MGGAEETDEEEEGQIWKALVGSRPEIEDEGAEFSGEDEDDDVDIADFMDDDEEDEEELDSGADGEGGVAIDGMESVSFHGFDEVEGEDGAEEDEAQPKTKEKKPSSKKKAKSEAEQHLSDEDDFDLVDLEDDDEDAFFDSDDEVPEEVVFLKSLSRMSRRILVVRIGGRGRRVSSPCRSLLRRRIMLSSLGRMTMICSMSS